MKIYFPCKEEQNTASNLSKSISLTSNRWKYIFLAKKNKTLRATWASLFHWPPTVENSGQPFLRCQERGFWGCWQKGCQILQLQQQHCLKKGQKNLTWLHSVQSNPQLIIPMSLDIQMLVWDSLFACERNSEQHCTAWKVKSAESTRRRKMT